MSALVESNEGKSCETGQQPNRPTGDSIDRFCRTLRRPRISSAAKSRARRGEFREAVQADLGCPDLERKISGFPKIRKHAYPAAIPPRHEGRFAIVTNAGRDAVDVLAVTDEQRLTRTAKLCGLGAPTQVLS